MRMTADELSAYERRLDKPKIMIRLGQQARGFCQVAADLMLDKDWDSFEERTRLKKSQGLVCTL